MFNSAVVGDKIYVSKLKIYLKVNSYAHIMYYTKRKN